MRKAVLFTMILGAAFLFAGPAHAAQTAQAAAKKCDLGKAQDLAELKKTKAAPIKSELQLRRDLLNTVIDCASDEATTLQNTLKDLPNPDDQITNQRNRYIDFLTSTLEFLDDQRAKTKGEFTIGDSKSLAKDVLDQRTTMQPIFAKAGDLVIWVKNQDLFQTSRSRLDQIKRTIQNLNLQQEDDFKALIDKATADLDRADKLNEQAKQALLGSASPDETISIIKDSLSALNDTYKSYFELSQAVKKILPFGR